MGRISSIQLTGYRVISPDSKINELEMSSIYDLKKVCKTYIWNIRQEKKEKATVTFMILLQWNAENPVNHSVDMSHPLKHCCRL